MWVIVWETELTWHMVPRSRGMNNLKTSRRTGIRMKKQAVYKRRSKLKWVPNEEQVSEVEKAKQEPFDQRT